jgi:hypothetical protein
MAMRRLSVAIIGRGLRETGNPAEDGMHARRKHQCLCFPRCQRRTGEQHVPASQQVVVFADAGVPRYWPGFARHRRVVHAYAECLEQATVCGHVVAGAQHDHIARDDIFGRNHDNRTVTLRSDLMWQQTLECGHRLLGPVLLPE